MTTAQASQSHPTSASDTSRAQIRGLPNHKVYHYAGLAFDLMYKCSIVPTPTAYDVLFNYSAGANDLIVKAVDGLLKNGQAIDQMEIIRLHEEFIENRFVANAHINIGLELEAGISNVSELIEKSMEQSQSFRKTLSHTQEELCDSKSSESLRRVYENLIAENDQMIASNAALGEGLQRSREQIDALNQRIEELEAITLQDPLTGIYNRRAFDARLKDELSTVSVARAFCLSIVDIDHFKRINDVLGHQKGDSVLIAIAELLSCFSKRENAIVARYGGEEFVILMLDANIFTAHNKLVELKKQISNIKCLSADDQERVGFLSASFGQSKYMPGRTAEELFEIADQKLYEAKRSGRNAIRSEGLNT